jgi:PKD repeat protein
LYVRWDWQGDGIWDTDWSVNKVVEHQFSDPAKYSVRLMVRNVAGLTANASAQVAVVLPPPTALSAAIQASPTSGTMPLTVSFISSGTGGVPPYGYHWDFGDGATSNAPNTVHIYVTGGDFPVSLLINDGTGVNAVSNVVVIHVTPAAVNLVVTTPHDFVATTSGFQVTFTASVTGGTPPYSYQWEFGDGTRSEEASPSHTYATAGAYSVSATAIDAKGQSATHVFTLNVPPHSTGPPPGDPSGLFVSGISISAAAIFAILWWTERKKGRPPQARL